MVTTRRGGAAKRYRENETIPIGSSVRKFFEGHGWFTGSVKSYDSKAELYSVEFEDGDQEQFDMDELKQILLPSVTFQEDDQDEPRVTKAETPSATNRRAVTPSPLPSTETPRRTSPRTNNAAAVTPSPSAAQSMAELSCDDERASLRKSPRKRRNLTTEMTAVTPPSGCPTRSRVTPTRSSSRPFNGTTGKEETPQDGADGGTKGQAATVATAPPRANIKEETSNSPAPSKAEHIEVGESDEEVDNLPIAQMVSGVLSDISTAASKDGDKKALQSEQVEDLNQGEEEEDSLPIARIVTRARRSCAVKSYDDESCETLGGGEYISDNKDSDIGISTPRRRSSRRNASMKSTADEDDDFLPDERSEGDDEEDFTPNSEPEDEVLLDSEPPQLAGGCTPPKAKRSTAVTPTPAKPSGRRTRKGGINDVLPVEPKSHLKEDEEKLEAEEPQKRTTKAKRTPCKAKKKAPVTPDPKEASFISGRRIDKWGLPRGALAKCPNSGLTIRALDSIPPNSETTRSNLLPGRLLVVAADDQGTCPFEFVGREFESADALHAAIAQHNEKTKGTSPKIRFATYEMEAMSDPAFASWEFAMDRLASIGLVAEDKDNVPILQVEIEWDGGSQVSGRLTYWREEGSVPNTNLQWAFLEGDHLRDVPPVLLGAPSAMLEFRNDQDMISLKVANATEHEEPGPDGLEYVRPDQDLVPQPGNKSAAPIKMAASLLQKAIRRGNKLCSWAPLLEAATELIHPSKASSGSTFAFLKILWSCMLVDVSPFDGSSECLGLGGILLLSLIARADPTWSMPPQLRTCVLAAALRTAQRDKTEQWIGFVEPNELWWELEEESFATSEFEKLNVSAAQKRAMNLRNILRATQAVAGGKIKWGRWNKFEGDPSAAAILSYLNHHEDKGWNGSYLPEAPAPNPSESALLDGWGKGLSLGDDSEPEKKALDEECRLAAIEPTIMPQTLVLLQAVLDAPPKNWKKHGLPSLARQVRKLVSEANPRFREKAMLARLETWGKDKAAPNSAAQDRAQEEAEKTYQSFREVVTPTGTLSAGEADLVNCFESIQCWQLDCMRGKTEAQVETSNALKDIVSSPNCHITAGAPLSEYDGRVAFLLAFASAIEVEVNGEVVSAMFCGTAGEPLLVQRIGKARKEGKELATAGGSTSGATAVPSLGYVQRSRSNEEAILMEGAELAVAAHWKAGNTSPLPIPPPGFQWEVPGTDKALVGWDEEEQKVQRRAEFCCDSKGVRRWQFSIGGTPVEPFDARPVISPCALGLNDKEHPPKPLESGSRLDCCLRTALYVPKDDAAFPLPQGQIVLSAMSELHNLAVTQRDAAPNEGLAYDWMPLARNSLLPARVWRDALLALRTRDSEHVLLGKGIQSDGTGAPRDMTEGVLVRIFHALEYLYPMALRKEGSLKFRVRPRGASYYHLMSALEKLGRGQAAATKPAPVPSKAASASACGKIAAAPITSSNLKRKAAVDTSPSVSKRPRRQAARVASQKLLDGSKAEADSKKEEDDDFNPELLGTNDDKMDHVLEGYEIEKVSGDQESRGADVLPLPTVTTKLWSHQELSSQSVVEGVKQGKRGHADASAVGAGKTLTALATIVRLAHWIQASGRSRHGVLVMLPTKALIREWLLEIATHTKGFHVIEQREDGTLFSLTYSKTNPPIDGNALIITTLDRVCRHPFVRATAWDFVVIDECLSVQNADAKRVPSAWRQIEISTCGVLLLSATFFRSKYDALWYMIRMLRSPLPRAMKWLPATIHEHIVCQIPDTGRAWKMHGEMVPLKSEDLARYRKIIEAFQRQQINDASKADGRKLWVDLETFLRRRYEGRTAATTYRSASVMGDAFAKIAKSLLQKKRRPLVFADTRPEADFLVRALSASGLDAQLWESIAAKNIRGIQSSKSNKTVIVAVKSTEGQGINMQKHADTIICRPTPGDHLEQMKGRIDRPGQTTKQLHLHVVVCEHSMEEAKFANIRLAGNFFREYIAPVANRYRERIDLKATLAVGRTGKLKRGTVSGTWKRSLDEAGQSGSFASAGAVEAPQGENSLEEANNLIWGDEVLDEPAVVAKKKEEPKYKPLNKVIRNKGDPVAVREAKDSAKKGGVSSPVHNWLFKPTKNAQSAKKQLAMNSPLRFSDLKPATVLDPKTIHEAVKHLTKNDPKLGALIARVGPHALINDVGPVRPPTQARLFDRCVRAITFTMVSVDAGNAFLRRLAIKIGVCLETIPAERRNRLLTQFLTDLHETGEHGDLKSPDQVLQALLQGTHNEIKFTPGLVGELVEQCEILKGKRSGYPHLCGVTHPCGKNDDPKVFLSKARAHANGGKDPVSAGFSKSKADFIVALVDDFATGKISGEKLAQASDREAANMLLKLKGIGEWCAAQILMHFLSRGDILMYGDLTVRNYLNDLYDINHQDSSETLLESAADFDDNAMNRNLIDAVAKKNGWAPYRSVVCFLMYHLQEENLVLL